MYCQTFIIKKILFIMNLIFKKRHAAMGYTQKPAECPFRKMRKILNSLFMVWFYLDYASVTNPRTGPCGSQLQ